MFKELVISKLELIGQAYQVLGNEIRTTCMNPDHNDSNPSYFINTDTGVSYCFSCQYAPHPSKIINATEEEAEELLRRAKYNHLSEMLHQKQEVKEQREFYLPPKAYDVKRNWRGLSQSLLHSVDTYYCKLGKYKGRLVFPIYENDLLLGFDTRIVNPKVLDEGSPLNNAKWLRPKGMEVQKIVYPYNLLAETRPSHILIAEGVADTLSYWELGVPTICNFGLGAPHPDRITKLLELGVTKITLAMDSDEAGKIGAQKLFKHYIKWFEIVPHKLATKIFFSQHKDANDYLQAIVT